VTNDKGETNAQRLLQRSLRTALRDDAAVEDSLRRALAQAGMTELPRSSGALVQFARVHLVPIVRPRLSAKLVAALIDDLEAEAEFEQSRNDPSSSSRLAAATRMPTAPEDDLVAMMNIPSYRPPSLSDVPIAPPAPAPAEGVITRVQNVTPDTPQPRVRAANERPTVLLVDPDRLGRVALARALVNAKFDVVVLDDRKEILETIVQRPVIDLLLAEIDAADAETILREFVKKRPGTPVLAWTKAARATADHVLRVTDVQQFEIFGKAARIGEVVEAVRRLVHA
jgi:hypothetical protein